MSGSRHCRTFLSTSSIFGLCQILIWISSLGKVAASQDTIDQAILSAYGNDSVKDLEFFCIPYNHEFHRLPDNQKSAKFYPLMDFTPNTGCSDIYSGLDISNTIVAVSRGDCSFALKATYILKNGGIGVLNVSPNKSQIIPGGNESDYKNINITVALIQETDFNSIKQLGENIMVKLFSPQPSLLNATEFFIFFLAMSSIIIGTYWSGVAFFKEKENIHRDGHAPLEDETKADTPLEKRQAKSVFPASIPIVIMMMCVMCAFLLGLYFLYDYLVYVVIFIFTVTSSVAFYTCFKGLWNFLIPGDQRLQCLCLKCYNFDMKYKNMVLALISASVGIVWFVLRHKSYAWIIQDILGLFFCIHVLKNIRIPSLKAGTIFLSLAFIYDIFFVFITPFFTSDGSSVMVDVATGGRSNHQNEKLPLVFRVPRFYLSPLSVCYVQESLLGFGDIILPGVLIVYNHIFDIYARTKKLYLVLSIIAYFIGLILAFVVLSIMKVGQPALLYLVPCVLLSTIIPACIRGELKTMWTGSFLTFTHKPEPSSEPHNDTENAENTDPQPSKTDPQTSVIVGKEDDHLLAS